MLTASQVRLYVKDIEVMNKLLDDHIQNWDELINLAMQLTVGYVNLVPPVTSYSVEDFPNDTIMLYGVLHHLANGEAERQLRNNVNYSAQGLNVGIDDKFQSYNSLAIYYKQLFDQNISTYKQFLNQEQAWGGVFSPYTVTHTWEFRD